MSHQLTPLQSRLEAIATEHSLLHAAHHGSPESMTTACQSLVMRYRNAIRRYLGGLLKNDDAADEVAQEVVVKLLQGRFAGVASARGRFRDYLKTAARNAGVDYLRRLRRAQQTGLGGQEHVEQAEAQQEPDDWMNQWRRNILEQARRALQAYQDQQPHNVYATVLTLLTDFPQEDSEQLAVRLAQITGRPCRPDALRKQISRARRKLAELIVAEVSHTLDDPTPARLQEELTETGLMPFVSDYLLWDESQEFSPVTKIDPPRKGNDAGGC
jgi:RNA polymerase sigma factor (sigma-70 family)